MPMINFSNPLTVLLGLILFVLVLILGKETHKSAVIAIMLFVFLAILIGHAVELSMYNSTDITVYKSITTSLFVDFIFVFLSFISYLWIDDVQAKIEKKKSIDDSLSWFWAKV